MTGSPAAPLDDPPGDVEPGEAIDDGAVPLATYPLRFVPTTRLRRLAVVAVLAVVAAVVSGRGELATMAAAPLVLLVLVPRAGLPRTVLAGAALGPTRCLEGDELLLDVRVRSPRADRLDVSVPVPDEVVMQPAERLPGSADGDGWLRWTVTPER